MVTSVHPKNNEKGQGLVEYALILVSVAVVVVVVLLLLGPNISNVYAKVNNSLSVASGGTLGGQPLIPTSTPPPWTTCANENGFCSFSGTAQVRYGAGSSWTTGTFTNGVACNNSVFGDPDFGVVKSCQVNQ
jgi:Flp pilus assembly pilin Flp